MGQTTKGIKYPSDYSAVADLPADLQEMAESIDMAIENSEYDDTAISGRITALETDNTSNKNRLTTLETDNTSNKNRLTAIETEQTLQNTEIEVIENCIDSELETSTTQKSTELEVTDSANYYSKLDMFGRTEQKQLSGKNLSKETFEEYLRIVSSGSDRLLEVATHKVAQIIQVKPSTTYVIDGDFSAFTDNFCRARCFNEFPVVGNVDTTTAFAYSRTRFTLTTDSTTNYLMLYDSQDNADIVIPNMFVCEQQYADTYEPYCGGQPSPNPDYPQDIQNVEGDVVVKVCNKNIFDEIMESGDISYTTGANSSSDTIIRSKNYIRLKNRTISIISKNTLENEISIGLRFYDADYNYLTYLSIATFTKNITTSDVPENAKYMRFIATTTDTTIKFAVIDGNSNTYVEHHEQSIDFPLSASQKMYEGDYFFKEDGKWYLHNTRNQRTINGTEGITWFLNRTLDNCIWFRSSDIGGKLGMKTSGVNYINLLCDKFVQKGWNTSIYLILDEEFIAQSTVTDLYLSIEKGVLQTDDVAGLNAYLASEGLTINYPLEVPTDTEITDTIQIERLEQLQKLLLDHGTNHIWTVTECLNPNLQLTYKQSNRIEIENIKNAIIAMGGNV